MNPDFKEAASAESKGDRVNPVRAGLANRPEQYRWSSLGYHMQTGNKDGFLSTDFGLRKLALKGDDERLTHYRLYVYKKGMPGSEIESVVRKTLILKFVPILRCTLFKIIEICIISSII